MTAKSLATTDQRLLGEIRDMLDALPLARTLSHDDIEGAKRLQREMDELHDRVDRLENLCKLIARFTGVDPLALTDDELALLAETGAVEEG